MEDNFSVDRGWGDGSEGNVSTGSGSNVRDGELWGTAGEALLARPLLTSCCVAWFLTGLGPVLVCGPGVGDP